MDIIDVTCFAGKAPVEHWIEADEEDKQTGLYWRQTYDVQTSTLSVSLVDRQPWHKIY